ncbi:hypothetical protein Godav_014356 [Gossypium davidsonii]|uniref:DUF4283 domain-containing protein n=2 Tax=Gossypium TaxID=3633 RepID=A0A7J8RJI2_GOSDV|nr:hypothetical protein [Gossypium davidsonii]MBA0649227.1 hypothetical protein [Gossypium klotzschianum]
MASMLTAHNARIDKATNKVSQRKDDPTDTSNPLSEPSEGTWALFKNMLLDKGNARFRRRRIVFNALLNNLYALWKPKSTIHFMDLGNDDCLVKVEDEEDYAKALAECSWIAYCQYLMVHCSILNYVDNIICRLVKIDYNIDDSFGGWFPRTIVSVDLGKPLILKI